MSGKKIKAKRRAAAAPKKSVTQTAPRTLELHKTAPTIRLDLACGQSCQDGFDGVELPGTKDHLAREIVRVRQLAASADNHKILADLERAHASIKHELNLGVFPWPFKDGSVSEIHCSHFVEHLPDIYVDEFGTEVPWGTPGAKDLFFAFFDECWRIMAPDAWMTVVVPCLRNNRAFQDPTHRRFYPAEAFYYLFDGFRKANKLDHYNVRCNFDGRIDPTVLAEMNARSSEVQQRMFTETWNSIVDWHVKLKAVKPGSVIAPGPEQLPAVQPVR